VRTAVALILAAATAAIPVCAGATAEQEQAEAKSVKLGYSLTVLAIPFGSLHYSAGFDAARYSAEMHFRTSGIFSLLWESHIDTTVEGSRISGALIPNLYTSQSVNRRGRRQWARVRYSSLHPPIMTAEPPYDLSRYPVTDVQKKGAVDPLTAISSIIAGLTTTEHGPCGSTLSVFDGRRRYDVVFTFVRDEPVAPGSTVVHRRVCKAQYRMIAGMKQEVVDVSSVPDIYAEFVDVPAISGHHTIARTIWSSFLFGAVNATLTDLSVDGRTVSLAP
jgi:hypothetical protein